MEIAIVVVLVLVALGILIDGLMRLRRWLNRPQPPIEPKPDE